MAIVDPYPMSAGCCGPHYSYPVWTGDPPPFKSPTTAAPIPNVMEQMGVDPISKLAAAIEKLADALREGVRD